MQKIITEEIKTRFKDLEVADVFIHGGIQYRVQQINQEHIKYVSFSKGKSCTRQKNSLEFVRKIINHVINTPRTADAEHRENTTPWKCSELSIGGF